MEVMKIPSPSPLIIPGPLAPKDKNKVGITFVGEQGFGECGCMSEVREAALPSLACNIAENHIETLGSLIPIYQLQFLLCQGQARGSVIAELRVKEKCRSFTSTPSCVQLWWLLVTF